MNFMWFRHSCDDHLLLDKAGSGSFEVDKAALALVEMIEQTQGKQCYRAFPSARWNGYRDDFSCTLS